MSIADASKFDAVIGRIGVRLSYPRKAMVYCEKDPAERVYKVLSGSVFTCKNLSDGVDRLLGCICQVTSSALDLAMSTLSQPRWSAMRRF